MPEQVVYVVARDNRPEAPHDIVRMILERTDHVVAVEPQAMHVTPVRVEAHDFAEARGIVEGALAGANRRAYEQFQYRSELP